MAKIKKNFKIFEADLPLLFEPVQKIENGIK
jgi:hypothetical protein